jgi:hypothetical protein
MKNFSLKRGNFFTIGRVFDYDTERVHAEKGTCEKWILMKSHKGIL